MSTKDDAKQATTPEERAEWAQHPFTQAWAKYYRGQVPKMLQELLARCNETTDPKVAAAAKDYVNTAVNASFFLGASDGR